MKDYSCKARRTGVIALLWWSTAAPAFGEVSFVYRPDSPMVRFAADRLQQALRETGQIPAEGAPAKTSGNVEIIITTNDQQRAVMLSGLNEKKTADGRVGKEGYEIRTWDISNKRVVLVAAKDEAGAMYGTLDLAEQVWINKGLEKVRQKVCSPRFEFRAIKFNLPWSSYRSNEALSLHTETCRDLKFWAKFLDMMAENRFKVLSLWNMHPFTYMIRPKGHPKACPFGNEELAEWQNFWRRLFAMAKERGIETYVVNWNIVVSPEFAGAYGVKELNDKSDLVADYTRECVTQVINEYEDLAGLGVTLADWMNNMTPKEREDWVQRTFVAGMKQANRPVKWIHRSVLAGSPVEMRRVIDEANLPDPVWVEVKFNWSHGHSTPRLSITHDYSTGQIDERFWKPKPDNYRIGWMVRNEDFFILRWGQPDFIRDHIATNGHGYVGGYFVGSECYIPAADYSHKPGPHVTWTYAFEKQWLFYMLWGRLLYDPETDDTVFAQAFDRRCGQGTGQKLLEAYRLASRMPLKLASFHAATWDFTLYCEGFQASAGSNGLFDGVSPFISINELIEHRTLDPSYLSIPDYVKAMLEKRDIGQAVLTPTGLADELEKDGSTALGISGSLKQQAKSTATSPTLECEIADVEAWAYLSLYFADKLRAGVAIETFRRTNLDAERQRAIGLLKKAAEYWDKLVAATESHYKPVPSVQLGREKFSWGGYGDQVRRDIEIVTQGR